MRHRALRVAPWLVLAVALVAALVLAGRPVGNRPESPAAHVHRLAAQIRCPTCEGLSAADSDAPASQSIRQAIAQRLGAGEPDQQIRDFLVSRYGPGALMAPPRSGVNGLVWFLPAVVLSAATGALAAAFWRWSRAPRRAATDEDRRLVAEAMRAQ